MAAVRAALPADAVLCGDSSQVTYFGSVHFFDVPVPRRFCYSPGYPTLGYGLPAGLGAAIGRPGTPVAVLLGDGALMFSVQELVTLTEQRLPAPVIVVDNGGYQEIREQEAARGIPPIGVELRTPDLAALAVAMGARGLRTTSTADLSNWSAARSMPTARPSSISISAERTSHHGYRCRRHLSPRHDRLRLLGQTQSHNAIRLPRRRPAARADVVFGHHGRDRAGWRVQDRRQSQRTERSRADPVGLASAKVTPAQAN
jgi:hypothetical protein